MLGEVLWVVVVIAFWAFVFVLVFSLVASFARTLDNEETMCELPHYPVVNGTQAS